MGDIFEQFCLEISPNQTIKFSDYTKSLSLIDGKNQTIGSDSSHHHRCHLRSTVFPTEVCFFL